MRVLGIFLLLVALLGPGEIRAEPTEAGADWGARVPSWAAPIEPFRVIGNIYYVGTQGLAVYLIVGRTGHALIDGGLPGHERQIIDNIARLGFDIRDVRYLLNTHAHFDHSGGLAALQQASGARLIAEAGDVSALEDGTYLGSEDVAEYRVPPVGVDQQFRGEITVGAADDFVLTGVHTPGHTRGCTSWRMTVNELGADYNVVIFCSASVAANRLVPEQYAGIVADYRSTFAKVKGWAPEVFLANHAEMFDLAEARARQIAGDPLAFVNPGAFDTYIRALEADFEQKLTDQAANHTAEHANE